MEKQLYERLVTKRVKINHFGKLGYRLYKIYIYSSIIDKWNYRLKNKFYPIKLENADKRFRCLKILGEVEDETLYEFESGF